MTNFSSLMTVMSKVASKVQKIFARDFIELQFLQSSSKSLDVFINKTIERVQRVVMRELQEARPQFGVISEYVNIEGEINDSWIINFIDGKDNFARSLPFFTFGIAVETINLQGNKEIISAITIEPVLNNIYYAEKGRGSWAELGGQRAQRLRVSGKKNVHIVANNDYRAIAQKPKEKTIQLGCDSLYLVYIASGKIDKSVSTNTQYSTVASGVLIAQESGAVVEKLLRKNNHVEECIVSSSSI